MDRRYEPALEIDNDFRQQSREWIMQRVAWVLLTALLIAIAFGLFGRGGPLSKTTQMSENDLSRVEYERFLRYHSPDELRLIVKPKSDNVRVRIDSEYVRHLQIERITPQPEREIGGDGDVTYVFNMKPDADVPITFHFSPQKYGRLEGWIAVDDGTQMPFKQFVYP